MAQKQSAPIRTVVESFFDFRQKKGWSLRYAANLLGCNNAHLYRVEAGEKPVSSEMLTKMIELLSQEVST